MGSGSAGNRWSAAAEWASILSAALYSADSPTVTPQDLIAAYKQLLQYRESLENPPLLVVCDLDRFEIHTNFTGTAKKVYAFDLAGLAEPKNLDTLRRLFTEPESLKPGQTSQSVTEQV